mmetsp:Transcript_27407/g.39700  ORF Transcript_27407/g.39700 Transcript_27407/m.39700 type:complete len:330 (-) Transcript_27407:76-1065(-)
MFLAELRVRVCDVAATAHWYLSSLGLQVDLKQCESKSGAAATVRFRDARSAVVTFLPGRQAASPTRAPTRALQQSRPGFVWIGLANFLDVASSVALLTQRQLSPRLQGQFEDVGFVAHLRDCNGITLELLQTTFQENFLPQPLPSNILRAYPVLGQAKFNISSPEDNLRLYRDLLGMRLLSTQPVPRFGFTLYFLAFCSAQPPQSDPVSLENREWLWQQPFTQVELQHWHTAPSVSTSQADGPSTAQPKPLPTRISLPAEGEQGFASIVLRGPRARLLILRERLTKAGFSVIPSASAAVNTALDEVGADVEFSTKDPDGRVVRFTVAEN